VGKTKPLFKRNKSMKTEQEYLAMVQKEGWTLYYVPEVERSAALCTVAVQQDGRVLRFVPKAHLTEVLYRAAVEQNGKATCLRARGRADCGALYGRGTARWQSARLRARGLKDGGAV
jgi:hypothetical protein